MKRWRLVAPALLLMFVVIGWPFGRAVFHSLYRYQYTTFDNREFVLFDNYVALATSSTWWTAVSLMIAIAVIAVAGQLLVGLVFAHVLARATRTAPVVRVLVLIPLAVMAFGAAFAWRDAVVDGYLDVWFGLDDFGTSNVGSLLTIILSEVWRGTAFATLVLFAGMTRMPARLIESAIADGASAWQRFWRIVVPTLRPAVLLLIVFRVVDSFSMFDSVYAIADPGPLSELAVPSTLIFGTAITRLELGLGSAMSVFLLILFALIGAAMAKMSQVGRLR